MRPLRSGPFAEVVEDELVAQKRKQLQQKGPKAVGVGEIWNVDMHQPETELPARHEVAVGQGAPAPQAVVDPWRRKRIVDIETNLDLDLLPTPSPDIDIDRSSGKRAGATRPNAVAHPRQHLDKRSPISLEAL